jgi:hypothetical protein
VLIEKNRQGVYITTNGEIVNSTSTETKEEYPSSEYPSIIKNRRYIDGCGFSSFAGFAAPSVYDEGYDGVCSGKWFCGGVTITENTMFRHMFALDPAKQAYNGWTTKDSSRPRYNKASDLQVVSLKKEFIGYPNSSEIVPISRYTPKASYENKNVMTDKTQIDREKPNMVTCSFGIDVYKTRCFNWISCGVFDEFLWIRKKGTNVWKSFESYKKTNTQIAQVELNAGKVDIVRKEFKPSVNNAVYARITNRLPGNNVLFTSHKVVIDIVPLGENDEPVVYEYVVGRADKDGNPDINHTNEVYTFTLYPSTYEGRVYQITDQQGFHWIEYQVWAATAEKLNAVIKKECDEFNEDNSGVKVFPILINTGDMTQSGARINEWLDYYNGGKCMFNHMEQMNCVGNNDLCNLDPTILGTGNDSGKSNAKFFHYFYCYEIPNDDKLIVKAHDVIVKETPLTKISISEDMYIPSVYYFETRGVLYVVANSEVTKTACEKLFGLYGNLSEGAATSINLYTGIEINTNGKYNNTCQNESDIVFYPIYETIYSWLKQNADGDNKKIVFACHEIPFTVITKASLSNKKPEIMSNTRNYPNGNASLLGSHMNQLDSKENRGTYWISRLLEHFGCKLCIGGHKHTYALSYPIKENYQWKNKNDDRGWISSGVECKPMSSTLEDESGSEPNYEISWVITTNNSNGDPYNVRTESNVSISSTKLPYVPEDLYNAIGRYTFGFAGSEEYRVNSDYYRCCSPIDTSTNSTYDGFINYSMCQATGYKLKSNKELPCAYQVFSKLIPLTDHTTEGPNGNQLYPMYSVIEFEHSRDKEINAINVKLCRVAGIFAKDGKDSFTQTNYGKKSPSIQYLLEIISDNKGGIIDTYNDYSNSDAKISEINNGEYMYGLWVTEDMYNDLVIKSITAISDGSIDPDKVHFYDKYLYIKY